MTRYTVTTSMTASGPIYQIYDRVTDAVLEGGFDTEKWAESICEMMNEKEMEKNGENRSARLCADGKERNRKD